MKVKAQHLQVGDIVGSGERIEKVMPKPSGIVGEKVHIKLSKGDRSRWSLWGKYTIINIKREEK